MHEYGWAVCPLISSVLTHAVPGYSGGHHCDACTLTPLTLIENEQWADVLILIKDLVVQPRIVRALCVPAVHTLAWGANTFSNIFFE